MTNEDALKYLTRMAHLGVATVQRGKTVMCIDELAAQIRAELETRPEVVTVEEFGMKVFAEHRKKNPNLYVPAFMRQAVYTALEVSAKLYPNGVKIAEEKV